ncbi:MAG: molybdenum cofactor guanylyltransferase [Chromatiales bacterium]|nr:molybdenum cofactor guanylyltransferase [Chromatiales bacterium]
MPHSPSITTVILAGGAARRMGGDDKGLITLDGRAMIAHVIERIAPQSGNILINCNRSRQDYQTFGYPVIEDTLSGGVGPLAGVLSALESCDSDYVLSVPCDTPLLPLDLVERMLQAMEYNDAMACTVSDGDRLHPVVLLVKREVTAGLRNYLEQGGRKVHDWFYSNPHCSADFSDQPDAFVNINTPEQLSRIERELKRD